MYIESGGDFNVDVPVMNSWKKWKLIDLSWIIINCFIVNGSSWKINWVNLTLMQFLYKQENLTVINENIQILKARNNREIPFFGDRLTHEFFFFFSNHSRYSKKNILDAHNIAIFLVGAFAHVSLSLFIFQ